MKATTADNTYTGKGGRQSRIICSTLRHYIDVQWGMSIAANLLHRQCAECPNWFSVHPGTSRPEKIYCSDACRMRAYRKRKLMSNSIVTSLVY
jgi:hypothetical protein